MEFIEYRKIEVPESVKEHTKQLYLNDVINAYRIPAELLNQPFIEEQAKEFTKNMFGNREGLWLCLKP